MLEGNKACWVWSSLSAFLAVMLMTLSMAVFAAAPDTGDYKEVYQFKFDKSAAKERAVNKFKSISHLSELDIDHLLFSSIKGKNCHGKPARYVIVFANPVRRPKSATYIIYDVSNPQKWFGLTAGSGPVSLSSLIGELRSSTFTSDIICGD